MALFRLASLRHMSVLSRRLLPAENKVETSFALHRLISSSEKKPSGHGGLAGAPPDTLIENPPRTAEDFIEAATKPRNWISYGFCEDDQEEDRDLYHLIMFSMFSVFCVFGVCFLAYLPDFRQHDWVVREGYLELARREKYGLPFVDKDLIPVERIVLPTEEEIEELGVEVYL